MRTTIRKIRCFLQLLVIVLFLVPSVSEASGGIKNKETSNLSSGNLYAKKKKSKKHFPYKKLSRQSSSASFPLDLIDNFEDEEEEDDDDDQSTFLILQKSVTGIAFIYTTESIRFHIEQTNVYCPIPADQSSFNTPSLSFIRVLRI